MKRTLLFFGVLAWGLTAILLLGVIVSSLTGWFSIPYPNFHFPDIHWGASNMELLREESFSVAELTGLTVRGRSEDIRVSLTDGDRVTIRQYGNAGADLPFIDESEGKEGGYALTITVPWRIRILSFVFWYDNYMEIELPERYARDLELSSTSGSVSFPAGYTGRALSLSSTSGNVTLGVSHVDSMSMSAVSGDIRLENADVAGDVKIETTSGGIHAADIRAQNAHLRSVSGAIQFATMTLENRAELKTTSGGIRAGALYCRDFDAQSLSGQISFDTALSGGGQLRTTSGGITASSVALIGAFEVHSTSGGVRLTLAPGQNCQLRLSSVSGGLRGNVPLSYDKNGKTATGIVGDGGPLLSASSTSGGVTVNQ